jgi:hypothetical protein
MAYKYKLKETEIGDVKVDNGVKSTVSDIDPTTGSISWKIDYVPNIDRLVDDVDDLTKTAKGVYQKAKDDKKFLEIYEQSRSLRNKIRTHVRNHYPEEYKKAGGTNESITEAAIDGDRQMITRAIENMVSRKMTVGQVIQEIKNAIDQSEGMSDIFKSNLKHSLREEDIDEISTSGGAGAYLTPYAFKLTKKQKSI